MDTTGQKEDTRDLAEAVQSVGEEGPGPGEGDRVSRKEDSSHSFIHLTILY